MLLLFHVLGIALSLAHADTPEAHGYPAVEKLSCEAAEAEAGREFDVLLFNTDRLLKPRYPLQKSALEEIVATVLSEKKLWPYLKRAREALSSLVELHREEESGNHDIEFEARDAAYSDEYFGMTEIHLYLATEIFSTRKGDDGRTPLEAYLAKYCESGSVEAGKFERSAEAWELLARSIGHMPSNVVRNEVELRWDCLAKGFHLPGEEPVTLSLTFDHPEITVCAMTRRIPLKVNGGELRDLERE